MDQHFSTVVSACLSSSWLSFLFLFSSLKLEWMKQESRNLPGNENIYSSIVFLSRLIFPSPNSEGTKRGVFSIFVDWSLAWWTTLCACARFDIKLTNWTFCEYNFLLAICLKQDWLSPVYSGRLQYIRIHSTLTPRCIDALFVVRIPFQSLVQSPEGNPDSSPPVQSPVHIYTGHRTPVGNWYPKPTYIYLSCDTRNGWSFYYIWHSFGL